MDITLVLNGRKVAPPLAAYYLLGNLESQGHTADVRYLNLSVLRKEEWLPLDMKKVWKAINSPKKVIAIGCLNDFLPYVLFLLNENRDAMRGKTIILGGFGPAEVAEEIIRRFDFIDYVVKGRDPSILASLLTCIGSGESGFSLDGVVWRDGSRVRYQPASIDHFHRYIFPSKPFPDEEKVQGFYLVTVEGCPYQCTFCDASQALSRSLKYRNLTAIVEEIKWVIRRMGKQVKFSIVDEAFIVNRNRVIRFCEILKEHHLDIAWGCFGRIDRVDEELLAIMRDAGCSGLYYGLDGATDTILKKIRKQFDVKTALDRLVLSRSYIDDITASFIWGYPFETLKDFLLMLVTIRGLGKKGIKTQLHQLVPVRGTEMYKEYKDAVSFSSDNSYSSVAFSLNREPDNFQHFVEKNADIFLAYSTFQTPDVEEKVRALSIIVTKPPG